MNTNRTCPQCGATLGAEAPEGLCPACLMKAGLPTSAAGTGGAAAADPLAPAEIASRFPQLEIIEMLGRGGMGVVYKARQKQLDRVVALKVLPPEVARDPHFAERFLREARALARLNHPNIVTVHEFGESGGLFYLIMEFVDGVNLRQLEQSRQLTPAEALSIIPKICDALQYAHEEGVVHRDIKPENILVDKKGRVKIADFGLAKLAGLAPTDARLTQSNLVMGTPHYMAPEQTERPMQVDHRADIYSLGVVFYEMLTGELPIGRFQPPSAKVHVDVRLDEVVLRSMEHDVERRYQHVSEMKTAVEGVTGTPPAGVPASAGFDAILRQVKWPAIGLLATSIFLWVIAFIIASVVGGLVLFMKHPAGQPDLTPLLANVPIVLMITWATLLMVGAQKMKRLESYGWAMTASILATVGGGLGLPFGIWALVVLLRPEVKAAFGQAMPPVGGAPKRSTSWVKIVLIGMACLLVIPVVMALRASPLWIRARETARSHMEMAIQKAQRTAVTTLKAFTTADPTISKDLAVEDGGWFANCTESRTIQLFEVPNPGVEDCQIIYRAQLKTEKLKGRAYLEMWCRLPGSGEFFSKGLDHVATGSTDWASYETPFFLKKGEKPDLLRLNLVVEGTGRVGIRNIEVLTNAKQLPAASAAPAKPVEKKANAATDVLCKMGEKYAALSSFTASGQVVSEVTPAGGGKATTTKHTFTINLARPEFYRITWTNAIAPGVIMRGAAWCAGDGHKVLNAGKVGTHLNREMALAAATGVSGGVAHTVPSMFFKDDPLALVPSLKNPILLPEERVGADACYVVAADRPLDKVTLWITKKDGLLKKVQTKTGAGPRQETTQASGDVSDESVRKILKTQGQDSTPDAVNKMKKQIAEGIKMIGSIPVTITATYEAIAVNEVMVKEDFEYSVPKENQP